MCKHRIRWQDPYQKEPDGSLITGQVCLIQFRGHPAVQEIFIPIKQNLFFSIQHFSNLSLNLKDFPVLFSKFFTFMGCGLLIGIPATVDEILKKASNFLSLAADYQRPVPAEGLPAPRPTDVSAR